MKRYERVEISLATFQWNSFHFSYQRHLFGKMGPDRLQACEIPPHGLSLSKAATSSETQGQLVGSIKCSCWKFTVRSRRAPGHLLLPNQFQKRLNCLLLIGQKIFFLANQRREAAEWLSCFLTRRSFPHRSPWLRSAFNGESFSRKVSEQNVNNPQKLQPLARLQETNTLRWIFKADLSKVS